MSYSRSSKEKSFPGLGRERRFPGEGGTGFGSHEGV